MFEFVSPCSLTFDTYFIFYDDVVDTNLARLSCTDALGDAFTSQICSKISRNVTRTNIEQVLHFYAGHEIELT